MITNTTVAHREHDHGRCLNAALTQAQTLCKAQGARLTTTREAVLRLIWQSHKPVGAYHIIEQLSAEQGKQIMPPTVYRALDFLLTQGLIHRIASLNAFVGCPFPGADHSDLFMLCKACGSVAECSADNIDQAIASTAAKSGFMVETHALEIIGLCPQCQ